MTTAPSRATASRLERMPVGAFTVAIGTSSFALVFREVERQFGVGGAVGEIIAAIATLCFLSLTILYVVKTVRYGSRVRQEFAGPVTMQYFPMATIAFLLLPVMAMPYSERVAMWLWGLAAPMHLLLVIAIVRRWILDTFEIQTFSPIWFMSAVGNLVAAMTGASLGFVESAWFFLSSGLVMWMAMFTIALYRLIFHDRIPPPLTPSLFILMTPPSAAFLAYMELGEGSLDVLGRALFFTALFLAAVLVSLGPVFARLSFSIGWWAFTFPSAALSMATLRYHAIVGSDLSLALGWVVTCVAVFLFVVTCWHSVGWLLAVLRAECLPRPGGDARPPGSGEGNGAARTAGCGSDRGLMH